MLLVLVQAPPLPSTLKVLLELPDRKRGPCKVDRRLFEKGLLSVCSGRSVGFRGFGGLQGPKVVECNSMT